MKEVGPGPELVTCALSAFRYHKELADRAVAQLTDEQLHQSLSPHTNCIAVILKHLAGNALSRWTDFLTTDGEKPTRDRDDEFVDSFAGREDLLAYWERGWVCLVAALESLKEDDISRTVTIRGAPHSVPLAISRSLAHFSYHVGQIVMIARILAGENWQVLTIPRGGSEEFNQKNWVCDLDRESAGE